MKARNVLYPKSVALPSFTFALSLGRCTLSFDSSRKPPLVGDPSPVVATTKAARSEGQLGVAL
jgi:hypothetical protein